MFEVRKFEEIIKEFRRRGKQINTDVSLPDDISMIYSTIEDAEITGDFIVLSYEDAKEANRALHNDFPEFEEHFWVFAETGQGDLWLISLKDLPAVSRVYYYDHDIEDYSSENMLDMNISLEQWFVLGDLMSQSYGGDFRDDEFCLKEPFKEKLLSEMENISAGLCKIYPFSL